MDACEFVQSIFEKVAHFLIRNGIETIEEVLMIMLINDQEGIRLNIMLIAA